MNIAFLHHVFQAGSGIEQVILDLAHQLKLSGHKVIIGTYHNTHPQKEVQVVEYKLPSRSRIVGSVLAPMFLETNEHIRTNLNYLGADVVVTSLYPMSLVPLWPTKVQARTVFIEWGIQPCAAYKSPMDKAYMWLLNRADRYVVKRSNVTIVANEVTKRWVEKQGITPVKLNLYGINFDRLKPNTDFSFLHNRHKELLNADGIIMYAGRQSPHKNIEVLIQAVALLKDGGRNVKLLIVGRESFPEYAKQLRMTVTGLGLDNSVIFTGLVSEADLARYYSICDIFVNASSWEGYLIPEAYAFKKPIIAYDIAPHDETVQHGVTGLLVKEITPELFASRVACLLDNKEARLLMGRTGYRWAKKNLDYGVIARKFIEVLEG